MDDVASGKHAENEEETLWRTGTYYIKEQKKKRGRDASFLSSKITQDNQPSPKQSRQEDLSSMCVSDQITCQPLYSENPEERQIQ